VGFAALYALEVLLLVVLAVAMVVIPRWLPAIMSTIVWAVSGESGSLMPRGVMSKGTRVRRTVEIQAVVSRLALITRLNLPLGPALEAAARGEPRRIRRVLQEMSRSITAGLPVSAAFEAALRGCPKQLVAMLRRAEECGQLTQALADQERAVAATTDIHLTSTAHTRHAVAYATFMMLFAGAMVAWIMILLMPKFREIFLDFNAPLPRITLILIGIASWFAAWGWWLLLIGLLLALGATLICACTHVGDETGIVTRWVAAVRWAMPITRTLDYGLGMSKAIRSMALAMRSGAPGTFAATLPSVVSPTNLLRRRLTEFARGIAQGVSPHEAARQAKLGDVVVCALQMVEHGEDPEGVLGHAAEYYEAIAYRWWHALAALSGPLVTLAIAGMVGFIALALFLPLIALINAVSESM
jgi:type II secretory pathway component PulF